MDFVDFHRSCYQLLLFEMVILFIYYLLSSVYRAMCHSRRRIAGAGYVIIWFMICYSSDNNNL